MKKELKILCNFRIRSGNYPSYFYTISTFNFCQQKQRLVDGWEFSANGIYLRVKISEWLLMLLLVHSED